MNNPFEQFENFFKASLPVASCVFFLLLMIVPWPMPTAKAVLSVFPLMILCFWVVNRPEHFSMAWSFIIGFLQDVLLGQPLGITALTYLAADFFLRGQRQFFLQQSFRHLWTMFGVVILCVSLVQWLVASLIIHAWVEIMPMCLKVGIGVLFFPMTTVILHHLQRSVFSRG